MPSQEDIKEEEREQMAHAEEDITIAQEQSARQQNKASQEAIHNKEVNDDNLEEIILELRKDLEEQGRASHVRLQEQAGEYKTRKKISQQKVAESSAKVSASHKPTIYTTVSEFNKEHIKELKGKLVKIDFIVIRKGEYEHLRIQDAPAGLLKERYFHQIKLPVDSSLDVNLDLSNQKIRESIEIIMSALNITECRLAFFVLPEKANIQKLNVNQLLWPDCKEEDFQEYPLDVKQLPPGEAKYIKIIQPKNYATLDKRNKKDFYFIAELEHSDFIAEGLKSRKFVINWHIGKEGEEFHYYSPHGTSLHVQVHPDDMVKFIEGHEYNIRVELLNRENNEVIGEDKVTIRIKEENEKKLMLPEPLQKRLSDKSQEKLKLLPEKEYRKILDKVGNIEALPDSSLKQLNDIIENEKLEDLPIKLLNFIGDENQKSLIVPEQQNLPRKDSAGPLIKRIADTSPLMELHKNLFDQGMLDNNFHLFDEIIAGKTIPLQQQLAEYINVYRHLMKNLNPDNPISKKIVEKFDNIDNGFNKLFLKEKLKQKLEEIRDNGLKHFGELVEDRNNLPEELSLAEDFFDRQVDDPAKDARFISGHPKLTDYWKKKIYHNKSIMAQLKEITESSDEIRKIILSNIEQGKQNV